MADDVQRVKDNLDITTVVSDYVELKQAGQYLKGKSPFTDERDPSFYVSPEKGLYHCFSSGQGGDMFTFIQEMEGVEFREALKLLADRAGVQLSGSSGDAGKKQRLRKVVKEAVSFYRNQLATSDTAQDYLQTRGITDSTAEAFQLGYAPDAWRDLLEYLQESGFTTDDIITAGLAKKSDNASQPYDRFRNRLVFPICDTTGRPIAFSGRRLDPDDPAKYINSPETPLFRKKRALYGFHLAKSAMRELDAAILVEGQTDLVLTHQAGYKNVVASSGTAVTKKHLQLINRFTDNLILALDTDTAGRRASLKTARLALVQGMTPKVAKLPDDKDPADVVTESGKDGLQTAIAEAEHIIPTAVRWIEAESRDRRDFLEQLQNQVLPLVTSIDNAITRDHFVKLIAEQTDLREKTIQSEIDKTESGSSMQPKEIQPKGEMSVQLTRQERQDRIEKRLRAILQWQREVEEPSLDTDELEDRITTVAERKVRDRDMTPEDDEVFAAELQFGDLEDNDLKQSVRELLLHFEEVVLQQAYEAAQAQIANTDDEDTKQDLLSKCQTISTHLQDVRDRIRKHA
jgi:DNA primase